MNEAEFFRVSKMPLEKKLDNFTLYVRRQSIARFLALYELFKKIIDIKGSIVECGVHMGGGLMAFAKLSANLEPMAIHRKIIGFDTFEGFPSISERDDNVPPIDFKEEFDTYENLLMAVECYDNNRFLNQYNKIEIIKGDAAKTIPDYINKNSHLVIALLFLDFDLYEPTKVALEYFLPRIPRGGIIAFDELNNEFWKGETVAALEIFKDFNRFKINKFSFDPNISYIIL
ncbi:MAG: hypothetical protein KatS3mg002_1491 [Candidatus Woesearchaeota archaeon]|nr:MAG: hypothetical protein KatS3mg002_1491 [Candidatus Woesearchaeota archaeon]